ncbi:hypothetical protein STEG23_003220, partial [Scotinomys teguina]
MTVTPLGRDQDCSLRNREPDVPVSWFLDPGDWSKAASIGLYFIFPGICTLSLVLCIHVMASSLVFFWDSGERGIWDESRQVREVPVSSGASRTYRMEE